MLNGLEKVIKKVLGRELSPRDLERTRSGSEFAPHENVVHNGLLGTTCRKIEYFTKYDKEEKNPDPCVRIRHLSTKTTPDFSHPHIMHTQLYNDKTEHRFYNLEGKLVERVIQTGSIYTRDMNWKVVRYEPAGSLFGKKADETHRNCTIFG